MTSGMIDPLFPQTVSTTVVPTGISVPGKTGQVTRPRHVVARALNENMEDFIVEGEDLLARAICHELDHLDGHMYVELVEGKLYTNEELDEMIAEEAAKAEAEEAGKE